MTKVTDDGASKKSARQDDKPVSQGTKSINLPDVAIKDPFLDPEITTGHKSAASSRNHYNKVQSTSHKRAVSNAAGSGSRYRQGMIPTANLKFNQFLEILFSSQMTKDEIKCETRDYVQVLETNYTDKIRELRGQLDKLKKKVVQERTKCATTNVEKSDLEQLFVSCVEDVRKEIIRRRLKAEVAARKKVGGITSPSIKTLQQQSISQMTDMSNDAQFEETLSKLADLAKNRVKFEEFTSADRSHLLDLFVNNEQTLLKVYEILFPQPSFKQQQVLRNPSD